MTDNWYIRKQIAALLERENTMPKTIRQGDTGSDVTLCQKLLCEHGFVTGVDGVFGSDTTKKVKAFQSSVSLTADGIVGPNTWDALEQPIEDLTPVSFKDVAKLFPDLMSQRYLLSGAQCPSNPPGVSLRRLGQETSNCVLFTAWLLSMAFNKQHPSVRFSGDQWSDWMVSKTPDVETIPGYGPKVVVEWGMGKPQPSSKGPWLVQWFTGTGGHSLIVLADDPSSKILTLESNDSIDGCGWNQIGPLREIENPGPNWADKVTQTWANRIYSKRAVHIVSLNIEGVREWLENV
jgi:hypothetical protein